jgi:hypothetical protein
MAARTEKWQVGLQREVRGGFVWELGYIVPVEPDAGALRAG